MDRIKKYQKLVKETLSEHILLPSPDFPNLQHQLIIDAPQQHFMLFRIGWDRGQYHHLTVYHLEIKSDGKIWIHQLNSNVAIDVELIEKGIAGTDIVAGMIEPYTLAQANEGVEKEQSVDVVVAK